MLRFLFLISESECNKIIGSKIRLGFPGGMVVMNPVANAGDSGDMGSIPAPGRSTGGGNGNPLQYFLPGESHGQRSLVGYSPWGHRESDMTE